MMALKNIVMKKPLLLSMSIFGWACLYAQIKSEIKINPFLFSENSSPTLLYEHTFTQRLSWELGLMVNKQKASVVAFGSFVYSESYVRTGVYGAIRWYIFATPEPTRGVFLGLMSTYTEESFLSPTLEQYFANIKESDTNFRYVEDRLLLGPLVGYKQVFWNHLTLEGLMFFSPYLTRQAKIIQDSPISKSDIRGYAGLALGYRF